MENKEYCPDCCVELKTIHKKIDGSGRRIWKNCPKCGYTSRPLTSFEEKLVLENFEKAHKLRPSSERIDLNKY